MYITKEQLEERLKKTELQVITKERKERKGISKGDEEKEDRLTHGERVLIGVLEKEDTQSKVAELMGVSQNTVSLLSRGITSPSVGVDKELTKDITEKRETIANNKLENDKKIQEQLITNLAAALGHVANNIETTDATEASKIAVDMSKILDRVAGKENGGRNRTAIIINVPAMKEEKHYQTITV